MNSKRSAILSGLITLCVLFALFIAGKPAEQTASRDRSVSAIRYFPVYSYLNKAETDNSFAIDTTHGAEGYVALIARCAAPVKVKLVAPGGAERIYNVPNSGEVAYYPLSDGNGRYAVQILRKAEKSENSELYEHVAEDSCEAAAPDEFQPYMRPSTYVWFTGSSSCVKAAAKLCAGQSNDDDKAKLIVQYVCTALDYDESLSEKEDQSFIRDPDAILNRRSGTCLDYAVLTAAMLRSQGIPAQVVYGDANRTSGGSHAWNMVYTSARGWFRLDTTFTDQGAADSFIADDANYSAIGWY